MLAIAITFALEVARHMNIHLTPQLEALVEKQVRSGRYNSASEVVREALRLFQDRERMREAQIRELQRKIDEGLASLREGRYIDGETFFRELEEKAKKRTAIRKRA